MVNSAMAPWMARATKRATVRNVANIFRELWMALKSGGGGGRDRERQEIAGDEDDVRKNTKPGQQPNHVTV